MARIIAALRGEWKGRTKRTDLSNGDEGVAGDAKGYWTLAALAQDFSLAIVRQLPESVLGGFILKFHSADDDADAVDVAGCNRVNKLCEFVFGILSCKLQCRMC